MPSPIQSQVITTIYNDQRNQVISPLLQELLKQLMPRSDSSMREEEEPHSEG